MSFNVYSEAFQDGKILDRYGKYSDMIQEGIPQISFPLRWENAPEGTKAFSVEMIDYDNVIGEGFIWIHWLAANIPGDADGLCEDASRKADGFIQGKNTWSFQLGVDNPVCNRYGGPAPEDRPHEYEVKVYALSEKLDLKDGYYYNEFLTETRGKILETAVLRGIYRA